MGYLSLCINRCIRLFIFFEGETVEKSHCNFYMLNKRYKVQLTRKEKRKKPTIKQQMESLVYPNTYTKKLQH
jgi:16S rRNA U516 pseudouridylate synthase RsuA-like enzyme